MRAVEDPQADKRREVRYCQARDFIEEAGLDIKTLNHDNGVMHLTLPIPGGVFFSGDRLQPFPLSAAGLSALTGNSHSEELDTTHTLSVEGGRLRVKVPSNPPIPLDAAGPNEFYSSDLGDLVFHTDAGRRFTYSS